MIAFITGTVHTIQQDSIVVLAGGIGYQVYTLDGAFELGDAVELHIFDFIREDRRELFGASSKGSLAMFKRLIDISGVGPKMALKIMQANHGNRIRDGIARGDVAILQGVSGVGKKTAQKIVLELQGVLVIEVGESSQDGDLIEMRTGLGYARQDAAAALSIIPEGSEEERIRLALKQLSA